MIIDGDEYTKCRVCGKYVQTGGTLDTWGDDEIMCDYLLNHCENDHPEKLDHRIMEIQNEA